MSNKFLVLEVSASGYPEIVCGLQSWDESINSARELIHTELGIRLTDEEDSCLVNQGFFEKDDGQGGYFVVSLPQDNDSYFPVIYKVVDNDTILLAESPNDLPNGKSFKILETKVSKESFDIAKAMYDLGYVTASDDMRR